MSEAGYRRFVGDQAVEFERRLKEAGVRIEMSVDASECWLVTVTKLPGVSFAVRDPILAKALWLAAYRAGLTEGLDPPEGGIPSEFA